MWNIHVPTYSIPYSNCSDFVKRHHRPSRKLINKGLYVKRRLELIIGRYNDDLEVKFWILTLPKILIIVLTNITLVSICRGFVLTHPVSMFFYYYFSNLVVHFYLYSFCTCLFVFLCYIWRGSVLIKNNENKCVMVYHCNVKQSTLEFNTICN